MDDFIEMMKISKRINFYKRPEIQRAIADASDSKEIAVRFGGKGYGKRPDVVKFPRDVLEFAMKSVSSFHASEELWFNPLDLKSSMSDKEKKELRTGWDLVIDIDCHEFEYSKIAAQIIVEFFQYYNIKSLSCKFSGNKGFHLGIPFECFPEYFNGVPTCELFPEAPRKIAQLMIDRIEEELGKRILDFEDGDFETIISKTKLKRERIMGEKDAEFGGTESYLKGAELAEIDTVLISSRHLYRMPYSFNEKSGLVSVSIPLDKVMQFEKSMAQPENVFYDEDNKFLDRENVIYNEAERLMVAAYDHHGVEKTQEMVMESFQKEFDSEKEFSAPEMAIEEEYFPPCMKCALGGMGDGKKRALFAMMNFFRCVGWQKEGVAERLAKWNEVNEEELKQTILNGQIRYSFMKKEIFLPQNCKSYYEDLALCKPDKLCAKIKNPVQYTLKKSKYARLNAKKESNSKKTPEKVKK